MLDSQEFDKVDQSAAIITASGPKKRKILKDLQANGEDDVEEEDEEENTEDPPGNQTGASEKNAAAKLKRIEDFEYDMFSDLAIGRGYDWIESNLDLATPDPLHQFSQSLDRIQVSKIIAGMIVPIIDQPTTISAPISLQFMRPSQMLE